MFGSSLPISDLPGTIQGREGLNLRFSCLACHIGRRFGAKMASLVSRAACHKVHKRLKYILEADEAQLVNHQPALIYPPLARKSAVRSSRWCTTAQASLMSYTISGPDMK